MHCGFKCHLLTIRWQVACHWPTDISTMRLYVALYLQQMTRLHGLHMLCNASVHRSSLLLVYRWHTMTIIAPPGYLTFCSFICLSLHCDDHVMYWYVKTLSIFVSLGAELRYIVKLILPLQLYKLSTWLENLCGHWRLKQAMSVTSSKNASVFDECVK